MAYTIVVFQPRDHTNDTEQAIIARQTAAAAATNQWSHVCHNRPYLDCTNPKGTYANWNIIESQNFSNGYFNIMPVDNPDGTISRKALL